SVPGSDLIGLFKTEAVDFMTAPADLSKVLARQWAVDTSARSSQMPSHGDVRLFKTIFHEAHVVDLDFSQWDKFVRIVAVGRVVPTRQGGRWRTFNVDFVDMAEFVWRSNHLGIPMGEGEHCQWTVDDYDIKQTASRIVVTLSAPRAPAPTVT